MIDGKEVGEKLVELKKNLQQRAEQLVENDPVCAEIRGNIASLQWVAGEEKDAESTTED